MISRRVREICNHEWPKCAAKVSAHLAVCLFLLRTNRDRCRWERREIMRSVIVCGRSIFFFFLFSSLKLSFLYAWSAVLPRAESVSNWRFLPDDLTICTYNARKLKESSPYLGLLKLVKILKTRKRVIQIRKEIAASNEILRENYFPTFYYI